MTIKAPPEKRAQKILENTSNPLVKRARWEAFLLCQAYQETNTRIVRTVMKDKGLIPEHIDDRWLGAVFPKCNLFVDTGKTVAVEDEARNIHKGRDSKIWTLAPEFKNITPPPAPTEDLSDYFRQRESHVDKLLKHAAHKLGAYAIHVQPLGTILIEAGNKTVRHTSLESALVELIGEENMP